MAQVKHWLSDMLSEKTNASCTRFCVVLVTATIMVNWTFLNVASMIKTGSPVTIGPQEIVALLGILGVKLGQKRMEGKKTE